MRPSLLPLLAVLTLGLAACAEVPRFDRAGPAAAGPAPAILPLDDLVARAPAPAPGAAPMEAAAGSVAARAARLRARAAAMRGPVQDPATRARLSAAIAARP